jgi:hypothetical protein
MDRYEELDEFDQHFPRDPKRRRKRRKYGYRVLVDHWSVGCTPSWWSSWHTSKSARDQSIDAAKRGKGILGWISTRREVHWYSMELLER